MSSWHEFLTMGGYAAYVWPAYGIAALVLSVNAVLPGRRLRRQLAELKRKRGGGAQP
ncbi:MAG: heme exporter protein CcmD [Gammaproteobacteria bacterium]|jgi:heme exporter protein D|nr:heme exporter protein CcmD [Gammaproteobacteria bacterium]